MAGVLELSQYYLDLQKKIMSIYPKWYDDTLMIKNSQTITEMFTQAIRNADSVYSEFFDYSLKNMRATNQRGIQIIQEFERYYDMFENMPPLQKNTLVKLIKEAKQNNDNQVIKSLEKKSRQNQKMKPKKNILVKDAS